MDKIIILTGSFFRILGILMMIHVLYKYHTKNEEPSNWKLFLLIVFLT